MASQGSNSPIGSNPTSCDNNPNRITKPTNQASGFHISPKINRWSTQGLRPATCATPGRARPWPGRFLAASGGGHLAAGVRGRFRNSIPSSQDRLGDLEDRCLLWIAEVDRSGCSIGVIHQGNQAVDHVGDVAKRSSVSAVTVNGDQFAFKRLHDKVRHRFNQLTPANPS